MTHLIVHHALLWGLGLSAFLTVAFMALGISNPEMWLNDYPPDIRKQFGPMSPKANRQRWLLGVPLMIVTLGVIALATIHFAERAPVPAGFTAVFAHTLILLMVFNVVDLLIIDWLFFVRIQPRFVILPGTEGLAGYSDYAFHWRAFLKGTAGILVFSVVVGGLVAIL